MILRNGLFIWCFCTIFLITFLKWRSLMRLWPFTATFVLDSFTVSYSALPLQQWKRLWVTFGDRLGLCNSLYFVSTQCDSVMPIATAKTWVNIGSDNGLLSAGTKPSPEPVLTYHQWHVIWHSSGGSFMGSAKISTHKSSSKTNYRHISQGPKWYKFEP